VKRAFHYAPLPQAIVFLVEKLEESETKWTKVADRLSRVPQPTKLLRILDTYSPSVPKGISLPNGFEQDTPDVIALLEELRELYIEGEQVVDKFLDDSA